MRSRLLFLAILYSFIIPLFADECNQYARTAKFDVCEQTINTYNDAFGRRPSADEIKFWVGQNNSNYDYLINQHRTWLKTQSTERQATITRSYQAIFHRNPDANEMKYWDGQVVSTGAIYKELLGYHQQFQVQQKATSPSMSGNQNHLHFDSSGNLVDTKNNLVVKASDISLADASGKILVNGGGSILSHDAGGIISHDAGTIISHDGGTLIGDQGSGFSQKYGLQSTDGKKTYELKLSDGRKLVIRK
jgi:hypothetical protein